MVDLRYNFDVDLEMVNLWYSFESWDGIVASTVKLTEARNLCQPNLLRPNSHYHTSPILVCLY